MTKIPSVEERVEEFDKCFDEATYKKNGWSAIPLRDIHKAKEMFRQALTAERTALLTELRDSGLLEKKEYSDEGDHQAMKYRNHNELGHNTLARAIKAHLDELIKSTSI